MVDPSIVTASAAALGSLVGAAASIATTLISQHTQSARSAMEWKLRERESLYKDFIVEASRLAMDALTNSLERPDQIMHLYGLLSRIRLVSGSVVVSQAEACCRHIIDQYGHMNMTTEQVRAAVVSHQVGELDPLKTFSNACRSELLAGLDKP